MSGDQRTVFDASGAAQGASFVVTQHTSGAQRLIAGHVGLGEAEGAELLASAATRADDAVSLFEFTRSLNELLDETQKLHVLEMMWRVAHADGRIDFADGAVSVANLELRHGEAKARLDGQLYAAEGLSFDVLVDDLALYVDGAFGEFAAAGVVSLRPDAELLEFDQ